MTRHSRDKFWICPICRSDIAGGTFKCFQCNFMPSDPETLIVKRSKFLPGFVLRRIALRKSLNSLAQMGSSSAASNKRADKYRPVTFHRNPESGITEPLALKRPDKYRPVTFHRNPEARASETTLSTRRVAEKPISQSSQALGTSGMRKRPAPAQTLDPYLFELYCAEWCTYFGHKDVSVTRSTKDGGVDVEGDTFIAQVKFQELPVGVRPIRELAGVLGQRKKTVAYFFTLNGFSSSALREGQDLGLALFEVKPFTSSIVAKSALAELVLEDLANSPKESPK